ncbi:hypothetical protein GJ633_06205 [Halorubrum sp. CBA1125]|jgi:hypothetical protein|uniref:hypothetical protein n=1 Tax=Halorubrum sp. CBA1125 TaxID=2668072 RepID=UPI0012E78CEE|nr:hypothetical protein [Halorubrum sp. CBA1125]MUW14299.1 hypothetical protein [Halorubrum sp. CBA1125]
MFRMDLARDEPYSASEDVAKPRLQLRHKPLEDLIDDGLVRWDREKNLVMKGSNFDRQHSLKS